MMDQIMTEGSIEISTCNSDDNQFRFIAQDDPSFLQGGGSEGSLLPASKQAHFHVPGDSRDQGVSEISFAMLEGQTGARIGVVRCCHSFGDRSCGELRMEFANAETQWELLGCALNAFVRFAFTQLGLHRLSMDLPYYSEDEIHMVEQAGFLREAQRRQALYRDGQYYDVLTYGMLRPDWDKHIMEEEKWTINCCAENA